MSSKEKRGFLELLSERTLAQYGHDLSRLCFVFPSRRAGIFFLHSLAEQIDKPIFSPRIVTIQELSRQLSGLRPADTLTLSCLLFNEQKQYYAETGKPFDEYAPDLRIEQCQRLVSDFNDIDNYLVPADKLFQNIRYLEELTSLDYLTDEQREVICSFWKVTLPLQSAQQHTLNNAFASFMQDIRELYPRFKERLRLEGLGYEGMIVEAAGDLDDQTLRAAISASFPNAERLVFVGLFAITPAEKRLLLHLRAILSPEQITFLWEGFGADFLGSEIKAPIIERIRQNRQILGGELVDIEGRSISPEIVVLESSSVVAGRKIVPSVLQRIKEEDPQSIKELRTAVIVPDERGLPPLISALSTTGEPLNVTMGYPFMQTNIAIWFTQYLDLLLTLRFKNSHATFSSEVFDKLIRHPLSTLLLSHEEITDMEALYASSLPYISFDDIHSASEQSSSEALKSITSTPENADQMLETLLHLADQMALALKAHDGANDCERESTTKVELEFVKYYRDMVGRLRNILPLLQQELDLSTVAKLLLKLCEGIMIPFEGEPLEGLQVMGALESRLLLFDYIVIPDANEGLLPRSYNRDNSYIPSNLRYGYGLPTFRTKEDIEAYYLYRLIGGAKKVFFITGGSDDVEPSRYILQLRHLSSLRVASHTLKMPDAGNLRGAIIVEKSPEIMALLDHYLQGEKGKHSLSAHSISSYTYCPLFFYFRFLRGIGEVVREEEVLSPIDFGQVIHQSMEQLYEPFKGELLTPEILTALRESRRMERTVLAEYRKVVFKDCPQMRELEGIHKIYADIAVVYVAAILKHDATYKALRYLEAERLFRFDFPISNGHTVSIKGYIDRLDLIEGKHPMLRIVDYKTGGDSTTFKAWKEILPLPSEDKHVKAISQLLLYSCYMSRTDEYRGTAIAPALYVLREMVKDPETYSPYITLIKESSGKDKKKAPTVLQVIEDYESDGVKLTFEAKLLAILDEIFDPAIPFCQTKYLYNRCRYCQFISICGTA